MARQIVNELLDELAKKHPDSEYRALVRLHKREHGRVPEIDLKAVLDDFAKERPLDGRCCGKPTRTA
jgi:hypothetical protein